MYRWLHISDIHFNPTDDGVSSNLLRTRLLPYIESLAPFDAIFLTGDLRYAPVQKDSDPTVAMDAVEYIRKIASSSNITDSNQIFMVPGNHDISRSSTREAVVNGVINSYNSNIGTFENDCLETLLSHFPFYRDCEKILYAKSHLPFFNNPHYISNTSCFNLIHLNTAILAHKNGEEGSLLIGAEYLRQQLEHTKSINANLPIIALGHHSLDMLEFRDYLAYQMSKNDHQDIYPLRIALNHFTLTNNIEDYIDSTYREIGKIKYIYYLIPTMKLNRNIKHILSIAWIVL